MSLINLFTLVCLDDVDSLRSIVSSSTSRASTELIALTASDFETDFDIFTTSYLGDFVAGAYASFVAVLIA